MDMIGTGAGVYDPNATPTPELKEEENPYYEEDCRRALLADEEEARSFLLGQIIVPNDGHTGQGAWKAPVKRRGRRGRRRHTLPTIPEILD